MVAIQQPPSLPQGGPKLEEQAPVGADILRSDLSLSQPSYCESLGKLLNLSGPRFPSLSDLHNNSTFLLGLPEDEVS